MGCHFTQDSQSGLIEKGCISKNLEFWRVDSAYIQGKCIPGRGNSQCKDPNMGAFWRVPGTATRPYPLKQGKQGGEKQMQESLCRFCRVLRVTVWTLAFPERNGEPLQESEQGER